MTHQAMPMSKDGLLDLIDVIRNRVELNDSYEGILEYTMPGPGDPEDAEFMVRARFRIGNLNGQGGMQIVGPIR